MKHIYFISLGLTLTLMSACAPVHKPHDQSDKIATAEPQSYGAYMIVMGKDYNPKDLAPYARSLPPIYQKYGGEYVAFSNEFDVAEGVYDYQALIISGWPDAAAARAFWDSPEYAKSIKLREGIGTFDVVIVPSLSATAPDAE